jgi:transposase InsO family protein
LGVTRGGYYKWYDRPASNRSIENRSIIREIKKIHREVKETYGSPRMAVELNNRGVSCCENTVAKLMRLNGIRAKMDRRYKPRQWRPGSIIKKGNLLENHDGPTRPHEIWVADFTYVKIGGDFKYFSTVMDLFSRKIVGIEISRTRNADMVLNTIRKALAAHPEHCTEIFHSDRGVEYANHMVDDQLNNLGICQSMSGKGNCYDNAHMESFFHTYKSELYYAEPFRSYLEFKRKTTRYIRFYNERRLHSSLGYRCPVDFEKQELASVNF